MDLTEMLTKLSLAEEVLWLAQSKKHSQVFKVPEDRAMHSTLLPIPFKEQRSSKQLPLLGQD